MDFLRANAIARKVVQSGKESITAEEKQFAKKIYRQITGKHFRGCSDCWGTLYVETERLKLETLTNTNKPMQQFKLKSTRIIQAHGFDPIGAKNLTDEIALRLLKSSKAHIRSFETFPENWEELVDSFSPTAVKPSPSAPKTKKADNNAVVELEINTDAVLAEAKSKELAKAKEKLEEMSKKELMAVCESNNYPKKEYEKLNKEKLVDYILERIK